MPWPTPISCGVFVHACVDAVSRCLLASPLGADELQRCLVWGVLLASVSGCGPVYYSVKLAGASRAVEEAREAGARQSAPYEYTYAEEHLRQAREFAGEAEYQSAADLATVAETYGNRARDIAQRRRRESGR